MSIRNTMGEDKNAFDLEDLRDQYAKNKFYYKLSKTYSRKFPEIIDLNTPEMWDRLNITFHNDLADNAIAVDRLKYVEKLVIKIHGKVLNIGFGSAELENLIYKKRDKYSNWYGVDISRRSVINAKSKYPKLKLTVGNIYNLRFKNNSIDCVVLLEVLEHIPPSKTIKCLKNIYEVLNKQGKLILSIPLNEGLEKMLEHGKNPNAHVRVYTSRIIEAELILTGFKILSKKLLYSFHKYYRLKSFIVNRIFRKYREPNNIIILAEKK